MQKCLLFLMGFYLLARADEIKISMQQTQISGTPAHGKTMNFEWDSSNSLFKNLLYGTVGFYALATGYLLYVRYLLNNLCAWNNWKTSVPLSELAILPQKNVFEMLTKSIEMRYGCPTGTCAMNIPQFLCDTTFEIQMLSNYKSIASTLNTAYLASFFFVSADSVKQADEKIKRLRFMQSIVANELEMHDVIQRFALLNYVSQKGLYAMQRVLGRRR